jgi:hypothetical protein
VVINLFGLNGGDDQDFFLMNIHIDECGRDGYAQMNIYYLIWAIQMAVWAGHLP